MKVFLFAACLMVASCGTSTSPDGDCLKTSIETQRAHGSNPSYTYTLWHNSTCPQATSGCYTVEDYKYMDALKKAKGGRGFSLENWHSCFTIPD